MENTAKEREELIEMFGMHFESLYHVPPLAARIMGVLIVDGCKSGLTFEALVEKLSASKSSISTNLKLLLSMEKVFYFTLSGDRKKYFRSARLSDRLNNYLKMIEAEGKIINRMHEYRVKTASCAEEIANLNNIVSYKNHIQQIEKSFEHTIAEFKKIEIQNDIKQQINN